LGQKVNPIGFRLGINRDWDSKWFSGKGYSGFVFEDYNIRKFLKKKLEQAGVSKIEIERAANKVRLKIHTARPGLVIGKKGIEIQNLKKELEKKIKREFFIDIQEVKGRHFSLAVRCSRHQGGLQWKTGRRGDGQEGMV